MGVKEEVVEGSIGFIEEVEKYGEVKFLADVEVCGIVEYAEKIIRGGL